MTNNSSFIKSVKKRKRMKDLIQDIITLYIIRPLLAFGLPIIVILGIYLFFKNFITITI